LKRWFRWHTKIQSTRTLLNPVFQRTCAQIKPRTTRCLQEIEVYQKLYYKDKVQSKVEEECQGKDLTQGDRLSLMKRISREQYAEASNEVKAAVTSRLAELEMEAARQRDDEQEAEGDPKDGVLTPSQVQRCVLPVFKLSDHPNTGHIELSKHSLMK
jgi:hypothetical protein